MKAIKRFWALLLLFTFTLSIQAFPVTAVMDEPIVAKTLNELKLALENPAGGACVAWRQHYSPLFLQTGCGAH